MNRSILTGFAVCVLSAGLPVIASANQTGDLGSSSAATTTVAASTDSAPPTDGADVAMWNASAEKAEKTTERREHDPVRVAGIVHVQKFASGIAARGAAMASNLTRNAMRFLGVPYVFGGTTTGGFDCSGYVQHVFAMMGVHLPRTADAQYDVAHRIKGRPIPGDLVFFQTYTSGVSHVGISLGGDRFVHASGHGVMVSSLHDSYWANRYLGARRVVL
ncbi:MAG TPA: C40 family peptidase [Candidatus Acidoferrum sp.]|nr:C40 family peptidase [Candidatus Acidoferrum sp.]